MSTHPAYLSDRATTACTCGTVWDDACFEGEDAAGFDA